MDRRNLARLTTAHSDRLLRVLTQQQHLHPGRSAADTTQYICEHLGYSQFSGDQVFRDLAIDNQTPIGRLSRHQIRSLAIAIESAWQAQLAGRALHAHQSAISQINACL